ncbi:hypothetical protein R3W88_010966 [Solanum pinnatisectum]|uniref:Mediator complex subunit 15 KIX domain-containing protein n=1 Tax=Solanum pinnatisectum TaxID=50273 RepID=A0AAV9L637_9SOLN|nr:hypothetical protein R3W88_010966 [Solanum pinnatisectum]
MDSGDWRNQLLPDSLHRIVNKILETLKRHLPFSGQEGVQELKKIAVRFEEKIYSAATSQDSDKEAAEEDDEGVFKDDVVEEVVGTKEQNYVVGHKDNVRVVEIEDAKVSRDFRRPTKYIRSLWTGNDRSKRKRRVAEMIRQSCKH